MTQTLRDGAFRRTARTVAFVLLLTGLQWPQAQAQSNAPSALSELSLAMSVEASLAALSALEDGSKFVVGAVTISGGVALVTVSAVGVGASFVVSMSLEALKAGAIVAGKAIEAVVISGGWLLYAGSEALCFVADDITRAHLHSREITL